MADSLRPGNDALELHLGARRSFSAGLCSSKVAQFDGLLLLALLDVQAQSLALLPFISRGLFMLPKTLPVLVLLVVSAITAMGQCQGLTWKNAAPASSPLARLGQAMAYDAARKQVVLFGGHVSSAGAAETWTWDGKTWTQRKPKTSPAGRYRHAMAYDAARQQVVLFGGRTASNIYSADTWTWDGSNWTQRKPTTSPPGREYHAMAYDAVRQELVLFGGKNQSVLGDTWTWDGKTWTPKIVLPTYPGARLGHCMVYDAARGEVLVFGGQSKKGALGDTWTWNGKGWTARKPALSPSARYEHNATYDSATQQVILFGGRISFYGVLAETWSWDGRTWTLQKPPSSPAARIAFGFAYDAARKQSVLFGGVGTSSRMGDTWLSESQGLRGSFTSYGSGCGPSPAVSLSAASNSRPTVGKSFPTDTKNLPTKATVSVLSLGASRTLLGPFKLPLSLASFGMPSCHLYTSYDLQWAFAVKNGSGSFSLLIPNSTSLIGSKVYMQSIGIAPGSNAAGILTSNGGEVLIGNL